MDNTYTRECSHPATDLRAALGQHLRQMRQTAQIELADLSSLPLPLSATYVARFEAGTDLPPVETLRRMLKSYKAPRDQWTLLTQWLGGITRIEHGITAVTPREQDRADRIIASIPTRRIVDVEKIHGTERAALVEAQKATIRVIKNRHNLTLAGLASVMGLPQSTVRSYACGDSLCSVSSVQAHMQALATGDAIVATDAPAQRKAAPGCITKSDFQRLLDSQPVPKWAHAHFPHAQFNLVRTFGAWLRRTNQDEFQRRYHAHMRLVTMTTQPTMDI